MPTKGSETHAEVRLSVQKYGTPKRIKNGDLTTGELHARR